MKRYSLYVILGIVYLAGLVAAISILNKNAAQVVEAETESIVTETTEDFAIDDTTVQDIAAVDTETESPDFEIPDSDSEVSDSEVSEPDEPDSDASDSAEDLETDDADEDSDEQLNLPAVYNIGNNSRLRLNLRETPSLQARIIGKCEFGESLTVLSYVDDDWVQVRYQDTTGYCSRAALTITEE
jgi:uncharacterized protein YgiM (DUF1202 family)